FSSLCSSAASCVQARLSTPTRRSSGLAPANGTLPRYRLQEWLTFIGTEIHKSFSPLFWPSIPEEAKAVYREKLASRFAFVDRELDRKSTRLNSSDVNISYAVFCLKKKV